MNAYTADKDRLRAYHLDRVTSTLKTVISADNAELLAVLLGDGKGGQQDVA